MPQSPYQSLIAATAWTWQGTDVYFLARLVGANGSNNVVPLIQSNVSSITYTVYDTSVQPPGNVVTTGTLTVSSVVFNSLQTSTIWTQDSTGFNFLTMLSASSNFPASGKTYLVSFVFAISGGGNFVLEYEVITRNPGTGGP